MDHHIFNDLIFPTRLMMDIPAEYQQIKQSGMIFIKWPSQLSTCEKNLRENWKEKWSKLQIKISKF